VGLAKPQTGGEEHQCDERDREVRFGDGGEELEFLGAGAEGLEVDGDRGGAGERGVKDGAAGGLGDAGEVFAVEGEVGDVDAEDRAEVVAEAGDSGLDGDELHAVGEEVEFHAEAVDGFDFGGCAGGVGGIESAEEFFAGVDDGLGGLELVHHLAEPHEGLHVGGDGVSFEAGGEACGREGDQEDGAEQREVRAADDAGSGHDGLPLREKRNVWRKGCPDAAHRVADACGGECSVGGEGVNKKVPRAAEGEHKVRPCSAPSAKGCAISR